MPARSRGSRWVDGVLIATLVPVFVVTLALQVRDGLATGLPLTRIRVSSAASETSFPVVEGLLPGAGFDGPSPQVGDLVLAAEGTSLAGMHAASFRVKFIPLSQRPEGLRLELARGNDRFATTLRATPVVLWWSSIPYAVVLALVGLVVLLRAPEWPASRRLFLLGLSLGIFNASDQGGLASIATVAWLLGLVAYPVGIGTAVSVFWDFTPSARPLPGWTRAQPWVFGVGLFTALAVDDWLPRPAGRYGLPAVSVLTLLAIVSMLAGLTRAYRRSDALERRQIRWVLYGLYVALLPALAINGALLLGIPFAASDLAWSIMQLALTASPIGFLVAVLGYRFLDIDRLISATASYTVFGVILLGVALEAIPRVATAASEATGFPRGGVQLGLALVVAGLAVAGHRRLRPWLDRRLFGERFAVEAALAELIGELGRCGSAQAVVQLSGERIHAILRPESVVVYARDQTAFTPVFALGRAVPPAFAAESALVKTLETRSAPLSTASGALEPFDRAALATLAAEVVTPTRRGDALVAFTCLGRKRSGDIYTPAELALLTAVASANAEVLQRLSAAEVLEQARAMQASLRRYVPGAVADQLETGRDVVAGEREVTVLFVDLRGYTSYAERRSVADVFSTVNEHTERVSAIVRDRGGAVVEFNGDGMMAVFGAPESLQQKERRAVEAAREIVDSCPAELSVGVGIATGMGFSGNIRAADRWIWSVIGDTTNLAARLQALTRELAVSIAIDEPTQRAAGYVCADFTRHREVTLRGRSQHMDVFALPLEPVLAASA